VAHLGDGVGVPGLETLALRLPLVARILAAEGKFFIQEFKFLSECTIPTEENKDDHSVQLFLYKELICSSNLVTGGGV
jgi:hypothetical protein